MSNRVFLRRGAALCAGLCLVGGSAPLLAQDTGGGKQGAHHAAPAAPKPLTRAEFIQQMDAEFARLDRDGNGVVLPEEIVESQREAARIEALRQNAQVFARLDKDGNGALSPEEFAALANPDALPTDPAPLLARFDTDRDEAITLVEYRIATQANFDRVDSDRDGVVTEMEMRAAGILR